MVCKKHKRFTRLLLVLLVSSSLSAFAEDAGEGWETKPNCDLPSASLKEMKAESREICQKGCDDTKSCQGFVYITGWKKCQLKAETKKQAHLRFVSGELGEDRVYADGSARMDQDHSGKDLERLVLDQADACGQACAKRSDCRAFTYLEGYRVCWLKKKGGRFSDKVFHCGFRRG